MTIAVNMEAFNFSAPVISAYLPSDPNRIEVLT